MSARRWDILVFCMIFTGIGAVGGWMAAHQEDHAEPPPGAQAGEKEDDSHGIELPPQTLKNLGVTVGVAEVTTFTSHRSIPAVITETPFNEQPVLAPLGGRVADVLVEPGMLVEAGATLLTLVRDPIPRPTLALTEEILKPAGESIHQAVVELRRTREEITIIQTELERVSKFTGTVSGQELPILPRQTVIDLRYNLLRSRTAHEQARLELTKHGFTEEQIASMAAGGAIPILGQESWRRALRANGLWTDAAQQLFATLPGKLQGQRWTVATVGELSAGGLVTPALIAWVKALGDDCNHFLEIGALLQKGYSVADLQSLHALHAFDPIVHIKAPHRAGTPDWDVHTLAVKPGARVAAGARLLSLLDPREMYLRTDPVGGEKTDVLRVLAAGTPCSAVSLVPGAGPELDGLSLAFARSESAGVGTTAYAKVTNAPLANREEGGRAFRTWKLRAGLRYVLRLPVRTLENVFVLPGAAVTSDGPHKVVFVPEGHTFEAREVEIAYQDEHVVVIPADEHAPFGSGESVVTGGAYALGLALRGSPGRADAHAGHGH